VELADLEVALTAATLPAAGPHPATSRGRPGAALRRLFKHKLVQFLALGALAFALGRRSDVVRLERSDVDALFAAESSRLQVPSLTDAQKETVTERALEDEVLYREAIRMGLDKSDVIVRQHLVQRMLLLAEDVGGASRSPSDAELRDFFEQTKSRRHHAASLAFVHVFAHTRETALGALEKVRSWSPGAGVSSDGQAVVPSLGDPFPLSRNVHASADEIRASFGASFLSEVEQLKDGEWSVPIASRYGFHLVRVSGREAGRPATFDEVKGALQLEWLISRRKAATARFLATAAERYELEVDGERVAELRPLGRVGVRTEASGED
jgi:peptidyl-prolyl cis-trans isomerase C